MPRKIEISVPAAVAERLVGDLRTAEGVIAIRHERGVSVRPPGDIVSAFTTDRGLTAVERILDRTDLGDEAIVSTVEPQSLISPAHEEEIDDETNEASLEEMGSMLRGETNLSNNYLMAMAFSGGVAAAGLWTDTVHIVVGAMVIAPGFEPILRIAFGLLAKRRPQMRRGLESTAFGYAAMFLGAVLTTWLLSWMDPKPGASLTEQYWIRYWTTVPASGVLVALLASAAGMAVIAAQRSVLSAGVMIALALVPGMTVVGMGVALGDVGLATKGLLRWSVDAAAVVVGGGLILGLKLALFHRRRALG